ncbi:hypothetical protein GGI42DRAFT_310417 [Trichoderma sp. SZMC 28013]
MKAFASSSAGRDGNIYELRLSVPGDKVPVYYTSTLRMHGVPVQACVLCFVRVHATHTLSGQAVDPFGPRADGDDAFCCQSRLLKRTMLRDAQHLAAARMPHSQPAAPAAYRHYPCHTDSDLLPCRTVLCNSTVSLELARRR